MAHCSNKNSGTIVLGIGNPVLSDDSAGLRVAGEIKRALPGLNVVETSEAGLSILDHAQGYDRLIVIDSVKTGAGKPGDLYQLELETLDPALDFASFHGVDLASALELGKRLGYRMPVSVRIYGIEIKDNLTLSEDCSEELKLKIPQIAEEIIREEGL